MFQDEFAAKGGGEVKSEVSGLPAKELNRYLSVASLEAGDPAAAQSYFNLSSWGDSAPDPVFSRDPHSLEGQLQSVLLELTQGPLAPR